MGRILVVDDHDSLRKGLVRALSNAGHDVEEAPNGTIAIERLQDSQFDVVHHTNTGDRVLGIHIAPEVNGEFRPGEMRHLTSGTERIRAAGYAPQVDLATGVQRYLDWIRQQADVRDYFSEAANILRSKGIVHRVKSRGERGG